MSIELCLDFVRYADWVWRRIGQAEQHGFPFGEETITETILLHLKLCHPDRLFIQPFTKSQEHWNGADWEWWIGRPGNWIGMRVQAKRISLPKEHFKSLFYQSDKSAKMQIEYLLEKAEAAGLAPIYTLYTHTVDETELKSQVQHCYPAGSSFNDCGCLIAHALDIENLASLKLSEIAPHTFPWHCLVCARLADSSGPDGPADHIVRLLRHSGERATAERGRESQPARYVPEVQSQLPNHVQLMRSGDDFDGRHLEKYADEWDLGGLALFDLGDKDE